MRKNVNVVAVLFEEVNTLLKTIDRKINDQHQNLEDAATKADLASEKIAIEKAFLQTSRNLSVLDQKLNQLLVSVQESEDQIRSGFESILST
jgi:methyl-accepting chemotaxis protein